MRKVERTERVKRYLFSWLLSLMAQLKLVEFKPRPEPEVVKKPEEYSWNTCSICKSTLSMLNFEMYDWIDIDGVKKIICPTCIAKIRRHPKV